MITLLLALTVTFRVIDGDTIVVGQERIRLLGIDAPEIARAGKPEQCYGMKARAELTSLLISPTLGLTTVAGPDTPQTVRIERHGRDKYGRTLAWVYVGDLNVSALMVARGYARVYRSRHPKAFEALERDAARQQFGMWAPVELGGCAK